MFAKNHFYTFIHRFNSFIYFPGSLTCRKIIEHVYYTLCKFFKCFVVDVRYTVALETFAFLHILFYGIPLIVDKIAYICPFFCGQFALEYHDSCPDTESSHVSKWHVMFSGDFFRANFLLPHSWYIKIEVHADIYEIIAFGTFAEVRLNKKVVYVP